MLDVSSSSHGILIPRVGLVETSSPAPIVSPAVSLMVYNNATANDVTPGYYYWEGSKWVRLNTGGGAGLSGNGTATQLAFWGGTDSLSSNPGLNWNPAKSRLEVDTSLLLTPHPLKISSGTEGELRYDNNDHVLAYKTNSRWEKVFPLCGSTLPTIKEIPSSWWGPAQGQTFACYWANMRGGIKFSIDWNGDGNEDESYTYTGYSHVYDIPLFFWLRYPNKIMAGSNACFIMYRVIP
jgi:hypothetical protein